MKVTGEQEQRLQQLAAEQGVTAARLMVETALGSDGWTATQRRAVLVDLFAMRRQLIGVSTNVNQMAAVANGRGYLASEADALVAEVRRAVELVESTVDGLRAL